MVSKHSFVCFFLHLLRHCLHSQSGPSAPGQASTYREKLASSNARAALATAAAPRNVTPKSTDMMFRALEPAHILKLATLVAVMLVSYTSRTMHMRVVSADFRHHCPSSS
jgi:hypothetical protein